MSLRELRADHKISEHCTSPRDGLKREGVVAAHQQEEAYRAIK